MSLRHSTACHSNVTIARLTGDHLPYILSPSAFPLTSEHWPQRLK